MTLAVLIHTRVFRIIHIHTVDNGLYKWWGIKLYVCTTVPLYCRYVCI